MGITESQTTVDPEYTKGVVEMRKFEQSNSIFCFFFLIDSI